MSSNLFFRRRQQGHQSPQPNINHIRNHSSTEDARPPNLRYPEFAQDSFTEMRPEDIIRLQTSNTKLVTDNIQLSNELAVMQQQNEELETYLRQVSDISKVHAQDAVKKSQKIEELQRAVELKSRQVDDLRMQQGNAFASSNVETQTVIPMHLRDKFQKFLGQILLDQRHQFMDGMQQFIASEEIVGEDKSALMMSIAKVGTTVTKDYATELELRLVGAMNQEDGDENIYAGISNGDAGGDWKDQSDSLQHPNPRMKMGLHQSTTSRVRFSIAVNPGDMSDSESSASDSENGDKLDLEQDDEAAEMLNMMRQMSMANLQMDRDQGLVPPHHGVPGYTPHGSDDWQAQLMEIKKNMERPPHAPAPFSVNNDTPYIELRDMLDALPYELAKSILMEQDANDGDRIRDVILQRGQWPLVRFSNNRQVKITNAPPFQMCLERLEQYMSVNETQSGKDGGSGRGLTSILDPQNRTGYRLHMVTAIVRDRNEAPTAQITGLNFRIGRMWTANLRAILKQVKFWCSLEKPASLLVLGPPTAEKCALMREITRQVSLKFRAALVDTRSAVGGFGECPLECGCAVRFYVNDVSDQHGVIEGTRSIFPQVVVVDEVLSQKDISSLERLQSEGISVIAGTNMSTLHALLAHPIFSHLLPPQHRINEVEEVKKYSSISPHLLVLQLDYDGTKLEVFKNIPEAIEAIKRDTQPTSDEFDLQWSQWDDNAHYFERMRHGKHKYLTGLASPDEMQFENSLSRRVRYN